MDEQRKQKCADITQDRIDGLYNDLKAYIYIRKNNLQHKEDDIGGGNFVIALSLFSALGFLGKVYYCVEHTDRFDNRGFARNERETFIQFMKFINESGITLGLPSDDEVLGLVWNGFRNNLAHRLIVEPGKSLITFYFETIHEGSISEILASAKSHSAFKDGGDNRNWTVNCDSLLAQLPEITSKVTEYIQAQGGYDLEMLRKVINIEW